MTATVYELEKKASAEHTPNSKSIEIAEVRKKFHKKEATNPPTAI